MFFQIVIVVSFHECRVPRVGLEDDGTPSFHLAHLSHPTIVPCGSSTVHEHRFRRYHSASRVG